MSDIIIHKGSFDTELKLIHAEVAAGFPSPADDYIFDTLDFNRDFIKHPEATFYGDVKGDSMKDAESFLATELSLTGLSNPMMVPLSLPGWEEKALR